MAQVGHEDQVLLAGEQAVDGRELAGHADRVTGRVGLKTPRLKLATERSPASAGSRVERICTVVVLPAPLDQQREDGALGDVQVDPVEDDLVAERLAQPRGRDRGGGGEVDVMLGFFRVHAAGAR